METKETIYEEMCTLLTDYEHKEELDEDETIDWEYELYHMLVKIQNRWEDTITSDN